MTQPASPALGFAFALQTGKGTAVSDASDFHRVRAITASLGNQQGVQQLPQEVGGGYHTGGTYKTFVAGAGAVRVLARLENDIGYLLEAFFGAPEATGTSEDGGYLTTYKPVNDYCDHKWMTARRYIPSCSGTDSYFGEELSDAKLSMMQFTLAPAQPGILDLALLSIGSTFSAASDVSDWSSEMEAYEDTDSMIVPTVSGSGVVLEALTGVDFGDGENTDFGIPSVGMQLSLINRYSGDGIQPELVIGQLGMDDLVLVGQQIGFTITYKWKNPELYKAVYAYTGSAVGSQPTSHILKTSTTVTLRSPRTVGTTSKSEQLKLTLNDCSITCPSGIQLTGGGVVMVQIVGVAEMGATPAAYATAELRNETQYPGVVYSAGTI